MEQVLVSKALKGQVLRSEVLVSKALKGQVLRSEVLNLLLLKKFSRSKSGCRP